MIYDVISVFCHKYDSTISGKTYSYYGCGWFFENFLNKLSSHISAGNDSSLLYDFNISAGDSVFLRPGQSSYCWLHCDSIVTMRMLSGQLRKNYFLRQGSTRSKFHWIEGFGDPVYNPFVDFDLGIQVVSISDTSGPLYIDTSHFVSEKFYQDISFRKDVKGYVDSCSHLCYGTLSGIYASDQIHANEITIFPNPCHGELNISVHEKGIFKLQIVSMTGEILRTSNLNSDENIVYPLNGLGNGLYILQIYSNDKIYRKKLMVE